MNNQQFTRGLLLGATVAVVFVTVVTVVGELYAPLKNFFKDLHGHHWVGKGIWSLGIMVIVTAGTYFAKKQEQGEVNLSRAMRWLTNSIIAGTVALFLFFIYEYLGH